MRWTAPSITVVCALLLSLGCRQQSAPSQDQGRPPAETEREPPQKEGCIASFSAEGEPSPVTLGRLEGRRAGGRLELDAPAGPVTFGVLANLKEPLPENLFNIQRYLEFFRDAGADALLVAGDSGESAREIVGVLQALADAGLPVLVIPGNRETADGWQWAMTQLGDTHPNVVDMTRVRLVQFPSAAVISLPGYHDRRYMHPRRGGCLYEEPHLAELGTILETARGSAILLAHSVFRGQGRSAIDFHARGGHAGDPRLTARLREHPAPFGIFADVHEAGGRATDLDSRPLGAAKPHTSLYLNPGLADATPWELTDGRTSHGMVALLRIADATATYHVLQLPPLTDDQREDADALGRRMAAGGLR